MKKEYFYNSQHLNKRGAALFSDMLGKDLKVIMAMETPPR